MSRIDPCHVCGNFVLHRGNWTLVKCRTCIRLQTILRPGAVARNIVDKLVKAVFERRLPLSLLLQSPSPPPSPPPSPSPFLSPYSPMIETILIPRSIYASSSWPKPLSRSQRHSDFHSDSSYLHSPPSSSNVHEQRQSSNSFGRNPVTQHSHSHSPSLDSSPSSSKVNKWWEWQRHRQPNELRNDRRPATTTTRICQLSTAHYSPQSQQDLSPLPSSTRTRTSAQVGHSPPSVLEDPKGLENVLQGVAKLSYATLSASAALWNVNALSSNPFTKVLLVIAMMTAIFAVVLHSLASFQLHVLESANHIKRPLVLLVAFSAVSLFATLLALPVHSWSQTECDPHCWVERALVSTVVIGGFASLMIGGWRMRGENGRSVV